MSAKPCDFAHALGYASPVKLVVSDAEQLVADMTDAELAAMDLAVWDRKGPCPVPTTKQHTEMAGTLPWLRLGFFLCTLEKAELAKSLMTLSDEDFKHFHHVLDVTEANCTALANMCEAAKSRAIVGLAYALENGIAAPEGGPCD